MITSHHHARPAIRTRRRERGALVVELAFVSVFLITIVAGTYDFGQGWRTGLSANESARTGARVGSARGPERDADFIALSGVKAALESSGKLSQVRRIVVFKSASSDGRVPTSCKTGTSTGSACQVITGADFRTNWQGDGSAAAMTAATLTSGCLNIAVVKNWCPSGRDNEPTSDDPSGTTSDYYGIWVQLYHDYEFPLLGNGTTIARTAVMRLEPKVT